MVLDCIRMLNRVCIENNILLAYIRGRRGINGTEVANLLAEVATATSPIGTRILIAVSPTLYERKYRKRKGPVDNATGNKCLRFDRQSCFWESSIQTIQETVEWVRWREEQNRPQFEVQASLINLIYIHIQHSGGTRNHGDRCLARPPEHHEVQ